MREKIIAEDREHLIDLIKDEVITFGYKCDLNHIDVSKLSNMRYLFSNSMFNGDISKWDVSNVTNLEGMFYTSPFNGDISKWNVGKVELMERMFEQSSFNGDISGWNVSEVRDMGGIFVRSKFEKDLSLWTPYKLTVMRDMFYGCNCVIPYWANYDSPLERKKEIEKYQLAIKLSENLSSSEKFKKKLKI